MVLLRGPVFFFTNKSTLLFNKSITSTVFARKCSVSSKLSQLFNRNDNEHEKRISDIRSVFEQKERFIPVTRHTLIRHLMEKSLFLNKDEQKIFEDFAASLDYSLHTRLYGFLEDLKVLFDSSNPDKETTVLKAASKKERLDDEFWLIQRLTDILEQANFRELPEEVVKLALMEHNSKSKVKVSVNIENYDILRFWCLGKTIPKIHIPWYKVAINKLRKVESRTVEEAYKRIVVAMRHKSDDKLILKLYKDVPIDCLEMLLPDGHISMRTVDHGTFVVSGGVALTGVTAKLVTYLAGYHIDWTLLVTIVTGAIFTQIWANYKSRHYSYLMTQSRILYYKNIANNRGLLTLLVDRAKEEILKETLLSYVFLLTNRPNYSRTESSTNEALPEAFGSLTDLRLEKNIQDWVKEMFSIDVEFNSKNSVDSLEHFGLLSRKGDNLSVLPLHIAVKNLPDKSFLLIPRSIDCEIEEGFDQTPVNELTEKGKEKKKTKLFGLI